MAMPVQRRVHRRQATSAPPPALLPLGSLFTSISDGVMSEAAAAGVRNCVGLAYMAMSGRILPTEAMNLGRSGDTLDLEYDRLPFATGQAPAILALLSSGRNDALMSTDPASPAGVAAMIKWTRNRQWALDNALPATQKIIFATTIGSLVTGEAAHGAAVNTAQKNWIIAKAATDPRIILWDAWALYNYGNCAGLSADTLKEHPDNRGGWALAFGNGVLPGLFDVLDGLVLPATVAAMQNWLSINTTNLDADELLSSGTSGNKTGTLPPTGVWPTGKAIASNLLNGSGIGVSCAIIDQPGHKQARAITSGSSDGTSRTVVMNDTANISMTGSTPGQYYAPAVRLMLDDGGGSGAKGLVNFGLAMGNFANISNTTDQSATVTGDMQTAIDWLIIAPPFPTFGSNGPMAGNPALTIRARATAMQQWQATIEKPRLFRMFTAPRTAPVPLWRAVGIPTSNQIQRITGTCSNGQTLRVEPGWWAGGGLDNAAFAERRIYQGEATDTASGMGSVLTTLSGSVWTWTATGLLPGKMLWLDLIVTTPAGSRTERSGPYPVV